MSELDKYSKHDPLAQHSSYAKKSKITVADTDAWLKKHGNGMDRLKKTKRQVRQISGRNTAKSVP